MINAGDKIPSVTIKQATAEGPKDVDPAALFAGKNVVMFSLPGAFTPTCSKEHLPGYVARYDELRAKGIDLIACLSVNDAFVMKAWAEEHEALGKIVMLSDGNATFTKALGLDFDGSGFGLGTRSKRYAMLVDNGVVKILNIEESPGVMEVSGADRILAAL